MDQEIATVVVDDVEHEWQRVGRELLLVDPGRLLRLLAIAEMVVRAHAEEIEDAAGASARATSTATGVLLRLRTDRQMD